MLNLRFLETFVWVARLRSFTKAAERLNATQAAISSRIATLEAELGQQLFVRQPRNLTLTPAGLAALARAEALLDASRRFVEEVGAGGALRGVVRIGVIDTIAYTWLVDLIRCCHEALPLIGVEITADTSQRLSQLLIKGEIDVALIMGPMLEPGYPSIELCSYACGWVASPALGLDGAGATLERLATHPIISFPMGSQPHAAIERFFARRGDGDVVLYTANSLATIIRMTVDGMGVAAIPPVVAPRELDRGELALVAAPQPIPPMRFHAIYFDGPAKAIPVVIAELAREVAAAFCRRSDPRWAWDAGDEPGDGAPAATAIIPDASL